MRMVHRNHLIDRESFVAQYLSLAIFTIGVVSTLGSDDLLAAFAAGRWLTYYFLRSAFSPYFHQEPLSPGMATLKSTPKAKYSRLS